MATFDSKSRYAKYATTYEVEDRRGRTVAALTPAIPAAETELGEHLRKQGQRLDHLANHYLGDANGFWRIAELNDAMLPDSILGPRPHLASPVTPDTIKIPSPTR